MISGHQDNSKLFQSKVVKNGNGAKLDHWCKIRHDLACHVPQVGMGHSEQRTMLTQHPLFLICVQLKCLKRDHKKRVKSKLSVFFWAWFFLGCPRPFWKSSFYGSPVLGLQKIALCPPRNFSVKIMPFCNINISYQKQRVWNSRKKNIKCSSFKFFNAGKLQRQTTFPQKKFPTKNF